jgi:type II secretory pathway component PulK
MRYPIRTTDSAPRRGVALIAVLVVVAVLALAAYRFSDLMNAEYQAADSYQKSIQAKGGSDSAIAYLSATLANDPYGLNTLNGNLYDNSIFQDVLVSDNSDPAKRIRFSIVSPLSPDALAAGGTNQAFAYGVIDEAGKININALFKLDSSGTLLYNTLMNLPNMTDDVANSIIYWIDPTATPRGSGATDEYYGTLNPSYSAKHAPLDSLEELLYVRGVTTDLLFGNDKNRNGILDEGEDDGTGVLNPGWESYLTAYSREQNVDSSGNPRIYVNDPDLQSLQNYLTTAGFDDTITSFIIAYRTYGPASTGNGGSGGGGSPTPAGGGKPATTPTPAGGGGKAATGRATPGGGGSGGGGALPAGARPVAVPAAGAAPARGGAALSSDGAVASIGAGSGAASGDGVMAGPGQRITRATLGNVQSGGSGGQTISSLYKLINAQVTIPASTPGGQPTTYTSPMSDPSSIKQYLPQILDQLTTKKNSDLTPRVNVNTAPSAVLSALSDANGNPLLDPATLQTVLSSRPSYTGQTAPDAIFQTPAWLVTEAGVSPDTMATLDQYITARSQVYRFQALGYLDGGGPTARVEAIIDINAGRPRVVYYRDLTGLGKGFNLPQNNQ